jgi:hypothetical protein
VRRFTCKVVAKLPKQIPIADLQRYQLSVCDSVNRRNVEPSVD